MNITARFASSCPCCRTVIQPGTTVEWSKGAPARHTACQAAPASSAASPAPRAARRSNYRCPNPRDCGDPCCDGNCGY